MKEAPRGGHRQKFRTLLSCRASYISVPCFGHFETRTLSHSFLPDGTSVSTARIRVFDAINGLGIAVRPWLTKIKCQNRVLVRFSPSNGEVENAVNPVLRKTGVKA